MSWRQTHGANVGGELNWERTAVGRLVPFLQVLTRTCKNLSELVGSHRDPWEGSTRSGGRGLVRGVIVSCMRKKTPRPTPGEDQVKAFVATLPVLEGAEVDAFNESELVPIAVNPAQAAAQAEATERRRRQQQEEFEDYMERHRARDCRRDKARQMAVAKLEALEALKELCEGAMRPSTLENYSTARIAEVIVAAIADLTKIAGSASPAAPRAREALQEVKRSLKRSEDAEAKRRQRQRIRGGKTPQQRSKVLTRLVVKLVGKVKAAHTGGEREFAGVALPEWSFGFSRAIDAPVIAVRDEWIDTLMTLVDDRVARVMERLAKGAGDKNWSNKWCDRQRDQARREARKCWDREVEEGSRRHRDNAAQDMVNWL